MLRGARRGGRCKTHRSLAIRVSIVRPQGLLKALNELALVKRLGQKPKRAGAERSRANAFVGKGRYEDERHAFILTAEKHQQFDATHDRHIDIRNHARRPIQMIRSQELFGRLKRTGDVPKRLQEIADRGANRRIIVDD